MTCLQLYVLFYPSFLLLIYYYRYIIITSDHYVNAKKWTFFLFQKNGSSHIILIQLYKIIGIFSFFKNIFYKAQRSHVTSRNIVDIIGYYSNLFLLIEVLKKTISLDPFSGLFQT